MKLTAKEAEGHIRKIVRTCRGPYSPIAGRRLVRSLKADARQAAQGAGIDLRNEDAGKAIEALAADPEHEHHGNALTALNRVNLAGDVQAALDSHQGTKGQPFPFYIGAIITDLIETERAKDAVLLDRGCRQACGYDFNRTILAGPLDGDDHVAECPKCGQETHYTPTEIEIAEDG